MGVFNRLKGNSWRTVYFFRLLPQLYMMFKKQAKLEIIKISILVFLTKFINMIVMFLPLKVLFLLSGSKNISFFYDIEKRIGRDFYIGTIIAIVIVLYLLNVVLQIYKTRIVKRQKIMIEKNKYEFRGMVKSHKVISKTYVSFCQVLGDIMLVLFVFIALLLLNVHYAIFYSSMVLVYFVILEQWAFPIHQTKLMEKLNIDAKIFIHVTGVLLYLMLFLGLIVVVLTEDMTILIAVLIIILVRLGHGALNSFFSSQINLRKHYL